MQLKLSSKFGPLTPERSHPMHSYRVTLRTTPRKDVYIEALTLGKATQIAHAKWGKYNVVSVVPA